MLRVAASGSASAAAYSNASAAARESPRLVAHEVQVLVLGLRVTPRAGSVFQPRAEAVPLWPGGRLELLFDGLSPDTRLGVVSIFGAPIGLLGPWSCLLSFAAWRIEAPRSPKV